MLDQELTFSDGVLNYDRLTGADALDAAYRAPRFDASEAFGSRQPIGRVDGSPCRLIDISFSGASFVGEFDAAASFSVGGSLPLRIEQGGRAIFEGRGVLRRVEQTDDGIVLGFAFDRGAVDLTDLIRKNAMANLHHDLVRIETRAYSDIPTEYKQICADACALINRYRIALERAQSVGGVLSPAEENHILDLCEKAAAPAWRALTTEANRFMRAHVGDKPVMARLKQYTEEVLTPLLLGEAAWDRAYYKPLGYPGDYLLMDGIYRGEREGATLFEKFRHILALHAADGLVTRVKRMEEILRDEMEKSDALQPFRAMNIGCGPAREVSARLFKASAGPRQHFTLIDQDAGALTLALVRARQAIARTARGDEVSAFHLSFMDFLRDNEVYRSLPLQDVIYSVGVFDYLNDRLSQRLIRRLMEKLSPSGRLVIANLNAADTSMMWATALVLDWELIYRDEAGMRRMYEGLEGVAGEVETDPSGGVEFLTLRKVC